MKFSFFAPKGLMLTTLVCGLAGCGGGGTSPDPDVSGPAIVDNSLSSGDFRDTEDDRYYDIFICDVRESGVAGVEMRSLDFDASILVYRRNSDGSFDLIGENDDISGQNTDARLDFNVSRGRSYRIIATSANSEERGDYTLYFSQNLGRPARVLPDANRTAQGTQPGAAPGVNLPPIVPKK